MRANEITIDDSESLVEISKTDAGIHKELTAKGYRLTGKPGVDQSAYIEPGSGMILKIFGTRPGSKTFTKDQKLFFTWAKFCMDNSSNLFLPRYYGYESFIYNDELYLQIRTEKLQHNPILGRAISSLGEYAQKYASIGSMDARGILDYFVKTHPERSPYRIYYADPSYYKTIKQTIGKENVIPLLNTIADLYKIASKKGYTWDLHSNNVMTRTNGWPVINEAWSI
jgi:hypothetical protein